MEHDDELSKRQKWTLVQERKDVALVVGNQARPGAEQSLSSHEQEEVCQDQSAAHFQSGNSTGGVTIFVAHTWSASGTWQWNHHVSSLYGFPLSASHCPL